MYRPPSFRLKISDLYREVGDGWASGVTLSDVTADMKEEFDAVSAIMDEVGQLIRRSKMAPARSRISFFATWQQIVYGSNTKARRGLGLDETLKLCMLIFSGQVEIEYDER